MCWCLQMLIIGTFCPILMWQQIYLCFCCLWNLSDVVISLHIQKQVINYSQVVRKCYFRAGFQKLPPLLEAGAVWSCWAESHIYHTHAGRWHPSDWKLCGQVSSHTPACALCMLGFDQKLSAVGSHHLTCHLSRSWMTTRSEGSASDQRRKLFK